MLKVSFTFFLILINIQAQSLYDSNCLPFVKSNNFIKAKSQSDYIDSSKRTERYFYWDRINKHYSNFIQNEDLQKEASQRYSSPPKYSITKCEGKLESCNSYKAYCIEEVAKKGIIEEINKWNDEVKNCLSKKYRELHPDYCDKDFSRSLLYLKRMAEQLAKTNQEKSPDVALFFHEAKNQFQQYYDDIEDLLASIEKEKNKEKTDQKQAQKKEAVINKLDICRDLIKDDDNDIGNKKYIDRLLGSYSQCQELNPAENLSSNALLNLEKMMTNIDLKTQERYIFPDVTKIALNQSVKATAATYMRFFDKKLDLSNSTDRTDFVTEICATMNNENCLKPGFKAAMYEALQELDKETKDNPIKALPKEDFTRDTKDFNKTLNEANIVCQKIHKQAEQIRKNHKCSGITKHFDKYDRMSNFAVDEISKCNDIKQKKFDALNSLSNQNRVLAQSLYSKATSTVTGHLLVSEKFRDVVDLPSSNWVKDRCIKGNGKAFNNVVQQDVKEGLDDLKNLNLKEISEIADQQYSKDKRKSIIKDYLKNNPNTIVDLLNQNPDEDYAKAICGFVREINSDDYIKVWGERAAIGVGMVAGVALSMTGIGAPIGVPLLATVGAATAVEAGIIIYDINELNYSNEQQSQAAATNQFEFNAALDSVNKNNDEISSRKFDLAMTVSFGTLDIASEGFKTARAIYKANKVLKANDALRTTASVASSVKKNIPYKIARGLDEFIYHAKKVKLDPEIIKGLSDLEKVEIGAVFSKLSSKEQRILALSLAQGKDLKDFIKGVQTLKSTDFPELFKLANKSNKTIDGKNLATFFSESDGLLYLEKIRKSKNVDLSKSEEFAENFADWHFSENKKISKELLSDIEQQLIRNKIPYDTRADSFVLTARTLKEGESYSSDVEKFVNRMNNLGVKVIYDPQYLKKVGIQGAYDLDRNVVYIDNFSIINNRTSKIAFHEGSHAYGIERYIQGFDDDFNLIFSSQNGSKIFNPTDLEGKKIPYSKGFWAQESKVFSNEIRQGSWAQKVNTNQIRRDAETLKLINQNALENTDRLLKHAEKQKEWLDKGIIGMLDHSVSIKTKRVKGQEVFTFNLDNLGKRINDKGYTSDIRTSIQAVTKEQKELVKKYLQDKSNPETLREIIKLFEDKANAYKTLTKENDKILDKILAKNKSLIDADTVTKADQKKLIDLSAKLSKTTKAPTPKGQKFNPNIKSPKGSTGTTSTRDLKLLKSEVVDNASDFLPKLSELKFIASKPEINTKYKDYLKAILKGNKKNIDDSYDDLYEGLIEVSGFDESQTILNKINSLKKQSSRENAKLIKDLKNQYSKTQTDLLLDQQNLKFDYIDLRSRNSNKVVIGEIDLANFNKSKFNSETKKAYVGSRAKIAHKQNPIPLDKVELESYVNFIKKNYDINENKFLSKNYNFRGEEMTFKKGNKFGKQRNEIVAGDYYGGKTELNKDLGPGWREFDLPISSTPTHNSRDGVRILYNGKKFLITNDHYNTFYKINSN